MQMSYGYGDRSHHVAREEGGGPWGRMVTPGR
ncbi:hypothetical protein J2S76_004328 [Ancylobacter vacuolatus]|uniref:Uncharacterized protein n=1 Tax=Ancylobacter vacuolatus TaxID=223389 RepID=A0ABU0DN76_9HYPH|nr:hypothetical protein [Ancylobacter vacuolatus]